MENVLGHFRSSFGRPRPRDGHSQIPYEKCLPNQGSKPKFVPWEPISLSFSIFGESLCGCFVYVVLLLLICTGPVGGSEHSAALAASRRPNFAGDVTGPDIGYP